MSFRNCSRRSDARRPVSAYRISRAVAEALEPRRLLAMIPITNASYPMGRVAAAFRLGDRGRRHRRRGRTHPTAAGNVYTKKSYVPLTRPAQVKLPINTDYHVNYYQTNDRDNFKPEPNGDETEPDAVIHENYDFDNRRAVEKMDHADIHKDERVLFKKDDLAPVSIVEHMESRFSE